MFAADRYIVRKWKYLLILCNFIREIRVIYFGLLGTFSEMEMIVECMELTALEWGVNFQKRERMVYVFVYPQNPMSLVYSTNR